MPGVHYKFSAKLDFDTISFHGLHISLHDLKRQIMGREQLKASNCDLQITDAQSKEEYTDDNALIPKNSSVIVRRIPARGLRAISKTHAASRTEPGSGTSKAVRKKPISHFFSVKLHLILNGVAFYMKRPVGPPPSSFPCRYYGKPGHYRRNCPTSGGRRTEVSPVTDSGHGIELWL
ncbi:E3 ubiquitin-protein ligase RBBP6-like [Opisthocomus hoazin]|uniref:E3 ubiquitin-protein ligase RBBP6-like n=1 Tax=Opisthocomus hoazin TaxID=30419 RepID=UPI003F53BDA1